MAAVEGEAGGVRADPHLIAGADDLDEQVMAAVLSCPGPLGLRLRHPRCPAFPEPPLLRRRELTTAPANRQ